MTILILLEFTNLNVVVVNVILVKLIKILKLDIKKVLKYNFKKLNQIYQIK